MAWPEHFLDELKARTPLGALIGRRVKLARKGRTLTGLCPFHNEKTPSFTVQEQKGFYHCFGCGAHGDAIKFVCETEGLGFREAVERLAGEAGLDMPEETEASRESAERRRTLTDVVAMAQTFFRDQLQSRAGAAARAYLETRRLSAQTIAAFGLGYAPDGRTALIAHLTSKGVKLGEIIEAGLAVRPEGRDDAIDFFRNRLTIPINDPKGRPVAFGARTLAADVKPKYINTSETPLFHKGRTLYNLDKAREPAFKKQALLVAEGYLDVIALAQAGFPNAVAPLGTALTEDQMAVLWKIVPEPVLCFDGDSAGRRAAFRALERALPLLEPQKSLRFAFLPEGLDPDDLIKRDGAGAMEKTIAGAKPLSEVFWEKSVEGADLSTPERRAGLQATVFNAISEIGDTAVRDFYRSEFKDRLFRLFNPGREPSKGAGGVPRNFRQTNSRSGPGRAWQPPKPTLRPVPRNAGRFSDNPLAEMGNPSSLTRSAAARRAKADTEPATGSQLEDLAVALLARHPGIALRDYEAVEALRFEAPAHERLRLELLHLAAAHEVLDPDAVEVHLMNTGFRDILDGVRRAAHVAAHRQTRAEAHPEDVAQAWRETLMLLRKRGELRPSVRAARAAAVASESDEARIALTEAESALSAAEEDHGGDLP